MKINNDAPCGGFYGVPNIDCSVIILNVNVNVFSCAEAFKYILHLFSKKNESSLKKSMY